MISAIVRWWNGCWRRGHDWVPDRPISLDGKFAALAGLWNTTVHCTRCPRRGGENVNTEFADKRGWWAS